MSDEGAAVRPGRVAGTVLHVSPHPDDECIGAPATLMALRDSGWRIVNLACSLGAPAERERRQGELRAACARAGFDLEIVEPPARGTSSVSDGLRSAAAATAHDSLADAVVDAVGRHHPAIVVGPSPHDRHPGHEVVGRAALTAVARCASVDEQAAPRLWLWGLWADLPFPTIAVAFDSARLEEILTALDAHAGELGRNDFRRLVRGRAEMNASVGPERVFGFGSGANDALYLELLCEVMRRHGRWRLGRPRWLDPQSPFLSDDEMDEHATDVSAWLEASSITSQFGAPGIRGDVS